jgi:hypothetical protein
MVGASEAKASDHVVSLGLAMSSHRFDGDVDSVTYQGRTIKVKWGHDEFGGNPWDDCDYGNVTDWLCRDKEPGEVIICTDRGSKRFFDFASAVAKLKKEGCSGAEANSTAKFLVKRFQDWCNDQWFYVNASVTIDGLEYTDSLGGIESDFTDGVINDLLVEAKSAIDEHQRNLVVFMRFLVMAEVAA